MSWETSTGVPVDSGDNEGSFEESENSQTTILTVTGSSDAVDASYNCVIGSNEWGKDSSNYDRVSVDLDVFGKLSLAKSSSYN